VRAPEPIRGKEVSVCLSCLLGWLRNRKGDAAIREKLGRIYAQFVISTVTCGAKSQTRGDCIGMGMALAAMQNEVLRRAIVAAAQAVRDEN
jgi:AMMECR1 domain-containing protein